MAWCLAQLAEAGALVTLEHPRREAGRQHEVVMVRLAPRSIITPETTMIAKVLLTLKP